ncbi:MAG: hypothetical protein KGZ65_06150 [Sphingomonadales bacterium]|nr:hypothetical protein [Sphingomonadaceae bacterium]MBS3930801.1 hypothetical protein [Sphingomonadales bacterium]
MTTPSNDFVKANTPESRELDVEGDHFAAHHIGGTTWRFGSGDEALDDRVGTITLAPRGYVNCGLANARWIVHALDQVKQQARADERRRIDELAARVAETPAEPHRTDGAGFKVEYLDGGVLLYPECDDDAYAVSEFANAPTLTQALEASSEGERGDVAAEKLDVLHLCMLAEALANEYVREAPDNVSRTTRRLNVEQILTLTRKLNPPAATNPTPEGPKPTGTIFELDMFRERLERLAADWRRAPKPRPWSEYDRALDRCGNIAGDFAAELKTLIDNCTEQYVTQPAGNDGVKATILRTGDGWCLRRPRLSDVHYTDIEDLAEDLADIFAANPKNGENQ